MKLDVFISQALVDVEKGMLEATKTTGKSYRVVDERDALGLEFDVAVTTVTTDESGAEGGAKAGIEVMGVSLGSVGGKLSSNKANEKTEVSRLKFAIHVPEETDEQERQDTENAIAATRDTVDWGIGH